jgi:AcrR family transcriptional regulator
MSAARRRSPDHPSRTQEERSAETRAKLLDAAINSVLEVGYAQTTTRRVAEQAGVSAGAQAYHFPRRVDLVAAAIERLTEQYLQAWNAMADSLPAQPGERLHALADRLWEIFSGRLFTVFVKLWIAAADDAELYERLAVAERRMARAISKLAAESIGDLRGQAGWEGRVLVALAAMRGLALMAHFEPRTEPQADPWPIARAVLIEVFGTSQNRETTAERKRARR